MEKLTTCAWCANEVPVSEVNEAGYHCYPLDTSKWPESEVKPLPEKPRLEISAPYRFAVFNTKFYDDCSACMEYFGGPCQGHEA